MAKTKNKKDNIIVAYFKPFGIRQICDILMLTGAILALVGAFVNENVLLAGLIVFLAGNIVTLVKNVLVLFSKINRKSPEYKNAIVNTCVAGAMFLIALFGLIYFFVV